MTAASARRGLGAQRPTSAEVYRRAVANAMSEAQLEENVRDACKKLSVRRIHQLRSRGTAAGLPDDMLIGTRMLWRELKTQKGKLSGAQHETAEDLIAAGQDFAVWRPEDWLSGRIITELVCISPLPAASIFRVLRSLARQDPDGPAARVLNDLTALTPSAAGR